MDLGLSDFAALEDLPLGDAGMLSHMDLENLLCNTYYESPLTSEDGEGVEQPMMSAQARTSHFSSNVTANNKNQSEEQQEYCQPEIKQEEQDMMLTELPDSQMLTNVTIDDKERPEEQLAEQPEAAQPEVIQEGQNTEQAQNEDVDMMRSETELHTDSELTMEELFGPDPPPSEPSGPIWEHLCSLSGVRVPSTLPDSSHM
jgi:hypothetical protein